MPKVVQVKLADWVWLIVNCFGVTSTLGGSVIVEKKWTNLINKLLSCR